ncbi:MAG: 1-acyl-sn-glycerol-3-phosphate acyltransferase [Bacilli bacterium]|nr:1-acyl-sn-glycerol-3-phosphate acyltransferase [Bacilli bacterium]
MKKVKAPLGYKIAVFVLGPIFKLYYNPKVIGKENIPKDGAIIVCGNHKHIMDQCVPILSTNRFLCYMAKKEYFDGPFAWFFKWVGCIPVNRSIKDTDAKEKAIEHLENGGAIGIFPEGTRNKTKDFLLPFKFGAVSMAKKTNAKLVPLGITGDYKFRSKNLVVRFGKPFEVGDMTLEEANEKLAKSIGDLMKKSIKEQNKKEKSN